MWNQFLLVNIHFAINLFIALVFFAVFWLYFDAWTVRKTLKDALKIIGLFFISISYLVHAVFLESTIVPNPILGTQTHDMALAVLRVAGYLFFIAGLLIDPIIPKPQTTGLAGELAKEHGASFLLLVKGSAFLYPFLPAAAALIYLRRATIGLEDHLKKVAVGFFFISVSELLALTSLYQKTPSPDIYWFVAPFGPIWIVSRVIAVVGAFLIGRWIFWYLLSRLVTQLFMIFTVTVVVIFLITTVTFTGLLLRTMQEETVRQLGTDAKVLLFTVESKKAELLSDVESLSQNAYIITAVEEKTKGVLPGLVEQYLIAKNQSTLLVIDDKGVVLARGEDKEKVGDSLSDDALVARALRGTAATSLVTKEGVIAPQLSVRAAVPLWGSDGKTIIGVVFGGVAIDVTFADGVKAATGLDAAIYGGNIVAATTLYSADGSSRLLGIHEENQTVKSDVLMKGKGLTIPIDLANTPYFAAYEPLKDIDNVPIGMVFVGRPQVGVLQAVGQSIEFTFLVTAAMIVLSIIPAYLVAKNVAYQVQ